MALSLGIRRSTLRRGEGLGKLAQILGIHAEILQLSSFVRDVRGMRLGNLVVPHTGWAPSKRICIGCLEEDAECQADDPALWKYRRTWWDLRAVGNCERHRCALVDHCPECAVQIAWRDRSPRFCAGCGRDHLRAASDTRADAAWEAYLVGRIGFGNRSSSIVLDALSVTDAVSCVLAIGETLAPGPRELRRLRSAHTYAEVGFELLQGGGAALRSALGRIEPQSPYLNMAGLRRLLNPLLEWLETHGTDATRPIGEAIKSHVRSSWIVPPDTKILDDIVSSASPDERIELGRCLGLNLTILDRLLRHAGIAGGGHGPTEVATLKALVASTVPLAKTVRMFGLDTTTIRALEHRGVLQAVAWTVGDPLGVRYDRIELERLVSNLRFDVPEVKFVTEGHVRFDEVAILLRSGSGRGDRAAVVMSILSNRLRPCANLTRGTGPTSFLFDERAVERLALSVRDTRGEASIEDISNEL